MNSFKPWKPQLLSLTLIWMMAVNDPPLLRAQTPTFEWANLQTSLWEEYTPLDMEADPRGGFKLAYGRRESSPELNYVDDVIENLDREGNVQWRLAVLPNIKKIMLDASGNTFVAGSLLRGNPARTPIPDDYFTVRNITTVGAGRVYVAKISPGGTLDWVRRDGGHEVVIDATGLAVDADGNYCLSGFYTRGGAALLGGVQLPAAAPPTSPYVAPHNVFLAMYSSAGQLRWVRVGESLSNYTYSGVKMDSSRSIMLSGHSSGGQISFGDIAVTFPRDFLIKFDPEGRLLWSREDGCGQLRAPYGTADFDLDSHDHIFLGKELPDYSVNLTKYNTEGVLVWTRPIWSGETVDPSSLSTKARLGGLRLAADGSCFVSGLLAGTGISIGDTNLQYLANRVQGSEAFVAKFDPDGNVRWVTQTYGLEPRTTSDPPPRWSTVWRAALAVDPSGGVFVAGDLKGNIQFSDIVLYGPPSDPISQRYVTIYAARLTDPDGGRVTLDISRDGDALRLRWPASSDGFVLEHRDTVIGGSWSAVSTEPVVSGDQYVATEEFGSGSRWYRLRRP